ncbi:hypothetical protein [Lysobacter gummosus]|uniref:Uncharacterized protein n=1 Tax=Lysobacter gummosus TaxID=262324 RepID=A0ABY3XCC6_9GAMM|nr:hypothetical protein [Lysobacter gummosus]UNP29184.1 hypothetical protein MOV92_22390 [Lysobacter gummosus]
MLPKSAATNLKKTTTPGSIQIESLLGGKFKPLFDPEPDNSIFVDRGGIGETRMNRSTYEFIRENCLFSTEGLDRYAEAVRSGKKPQLSLPSDSIEGKAVWIVLTDAQLSSGVGNTYYTIKHDGKTYGLNSFHILTKDIPNWFWATFHHKSTPKNEFETPDTFGQPRDVTGTVWENYVLGGTQIDFVSPTGDPTVLSDHFIEFDFQRSSCITCHAMATTTTDRNDKDRPRQTLDLGVPNAATFKRGGKPFYVQTDFLWSMPFRAQSEKQPPPARCIW